MGKFSTCCCGCYVIPLEDLPTVTKSGWTATSWSGDCCRCITLTPNVPLDWIECCSEPFAEHSYTITQNASAYGSRTRKPRIFPFPGPGTLLEEHCCEVPKTIAELEAIETKTNEYKLLGAIRYNAIEVCISKQDVTCDGITSEKWVVISRYYHEHSAYGTIGRTDTGTRTITAVDDVEGCITAGPALSTYECNEPAPCALADLDDGGGGRKSNYRGLSMGGTSYFTRVKFYDTLPTGLIEFTDTDVPGDCTWSSCGAEDDYETQFCLSVSSLPSSISDCFCGSSDAKDTETTIYTLLSECCDRRCSFVIGNPIGTDVIYCDVDTFLTGCIVGCNFADCGTYSRTETTGAVDEAIELDCPQWKDDFGTFDCEGFDDVSVTTVDCEDNPDCGWGVTCPDGGCGPAKYRFDGGILGQFFETGATLTTECTFTARSCCFNAPSWSVTFS